MEMHQCRYVVAVARAGTFSRAAQQCHVSQPSLSQQIQKLEDELGERLFDRTKRGARLTQHGEAFLRHAACILDEAEAARREVADARDLRCGTIAVGVLPTMAPYVLPAAMAQFAEAYPGVEIIVQEDTTARLIRLLLRCEIDLALASGPIQDGRLEVRELGTEELLLALPAGHRLARRRSVAAGDLDGERLIVMKEEHCLGDQVLGFCERRETNPVISFRSAQIETIQALVSAGLGISLIPAMAVHPVSPASLIFRSLKPPRPERKIVATWPKQRPPARALIEFLNIVAARFAGPKEKPRRTHPQRRAGSRRRRNK